MYSAISSGASTILVNLTSPRSYGLTEVVEN